MTVTNHMCMMDVDEEGALLFIRLGVNYCTHMITYGQPIVVHVAE